jgi:chlorobactene glucosyltransferase
MTYLLIFITCALIVIAGISISNVFLLPRLRRTRAAYEPPFVSVLIPARNEAHVIGRTVKALLAQDCSNFELIVLDDASEDGTGEVARQAGAGDSRLRVLPGVPLPSGWIGKSWACHNLSQHARGDLLVFTDADVIWQPEALSAVVEQMQRTQAHMLTVWPTQTTSTPAERLIVPLMAFAIIGYLPVLLTHYSRFSITAAANGQCMAWRRAAYQRVGGHTIVAANVLDDVTLARAAKRAGLRIRMFDGNHLIGCRMYDGWSSVRDGFAKNILAGYGSVPALLAGTVFHLLTFIAPWFMLLLPDYRLWAVLLIAVGVLVRMLTASYTHQRLLDALFMPISVLMMTRIALHSIMWHYTGGPRWKGRSLKQASSNDQANTLQNPQEDTTWLSNPSSSSVQVSGD